MCCQRRARAFAHSSPPSYCSSVKSLFSNLSVTGLTVVELDKEANGQQMQDTLAEITGQRTVPNVFIGGKHIGGNDATQSLFRAGTLNALLKGAGALA